MLRSRHLLARLQSRHYYHRALSTASAPHKGTAVSEILSSATQANPLKDAVKFYSADGSFTGAVTPGASTDPDIWSYHQLSTNVNALTAGLQTLSYGPGDKILTYLPYTSPEYVTLLFAAANLGSTIVPCSSKEELFSAIDKMSPKMIIFDPTLCNGEDFLEELSPGIGEKDGSGYHGFAPLSGKGFESTKYSSVNHVVHTNSSHIRGAISFKSLLAYTGSSIPLKKVSKNALIISSDGSTLKTKEAISDAVEMGSKLQLSPDQASKQGKVVVNGSHKANTATAIISAIMHESLWIMPGTPDKAAEIAEVENATLVQ